MDPGEVAARNRQVARDARAGRDHDRVESPQLVGRDVPAHIGAEPEHDTLVRQLLHAALDDPLLDLEIGNAEPHQAAARLVALEHRHGVACAAKLLSAGHPGRPGADHGDRMPGLADRRSRPDPALFPGAVHDRELDLLDRHRLALTDLEHARRLARSGAEATGEVREVVRAVKLLDRGLPAAAEDRVVPVRDQVVHRAAVVAERHAALHAAGALLGQLRVGERVHELVVVEHPLRGHALRVLDPAQLEERAELAHQTALPLSTSAVTKPSPVVDTTCSSG